VSKPAAIETLEPLATSSALGVIVACVGTCGHSFALLAPRDVDEELVEREPSHPCPECWIAGRRKP
jgi:hypothetical protein